jgi:hypothetical protein
MVKPIRLRLTILEERMSTTLLASMLRKRAAAFWQPGAEPEAKTFPFMPTPPAARKPPSFHITAQYPEAQETKLSPPAGLDVKMPKAWGTGTKLPQLGLPAHVTSPDMDVDLTPAPGESVGEPSRTGAIARPDAPDAAAASWYAQNDANATWTDKIKDTWNTRVKPGISDTVDGFKQSPMNWGAKQWGTVGAGVGAAGLLAYLLTRKKKQKKTAAAFGKAFAGMKFDKLNLSSLKDLLRGGGAKPAPKPAPVGTPPPAPVGTPPPAPVGTLSPAAAPRAGRMRDIATGAVLGGTGVALGDQDNRDSLKAGWRAARAAHGTAPTGPSWMDSAKSWAGGATDWVNANPGTAAAGVGAAGLLAYLLSRREEPDDEAA